MLRMGRPEGPTGLSHDRRRRDPGGTRTRSDETTLVPGSVFARARARAKQVHERTTRPLEGGFRFSLEVWWAGRDLNPGPTD